MLTMKTKITGLLLCLLLAAACTTATKEKTEEPYGNPPAEGFNLEGSDAEAMVIADEVMEAMGGREAWDNTRHLCWRFFGRDELVWDKWTGNVRIDRPDTTTLLYNINTNEGKAFKKGQEVTDAEELERLNETARRIWINHSYWLVMPYKLKDSGVTLKYMGEEADNGGNNCDKLELTFEGVGVTPDNRYWVWVDKDRKLVSQWAYYRNAADTAQGFNVPFEDYQQRGEILLSGGRGGDRKLDNIMVFEELPESVYTQAQKPNLQAMMQ